MTLLETDCPWQTLMDGPYDRWQEHEKEVERAYNADEIDLATARRRKWGFDGMLDNACNAKERTACVLGKLNQQVCNGGFLQWVDNSYAIDSWHDLEDLLSKMGPVSLKVLELCREMMTWVDEDGEIDGVHDEEDGQYVHEQACLASDRLSDAFYALDDAWHPEVYAYLAD